MKSHNAKGLKRLMLAVQWSGKGLQYAFANEIAFRQELLLSLLLVPLALWIGESPVEKACLVSSVLIVLAVELINSSIEAAVDRISQEEHPLAGYAKDMGSAAVTVSLLNAAAIWALLLWM
jgi:diacylglycerol kinase (ATP)